MSRNLVRSKGPPDTNRRQAPDPCKEVSSLTGPSGRLRFAISVISVLGVLLAAMVAGSVEDIAQTVRAKLDYCPQQSQESCLFIVVTDVSEYFVDLSYVLTVSVHDRTRIVEE